MMYKLWAMVVQNMNNIDTKSWEIKMKEIYQKDGWTLNKKDLPILFIAGSNDPVIIDEEKWNESQEFLKKIGYSNVTGKLYKNLRHEILNEKNKQQIYEDIINFI